MVGVVILLGVEAYLAGRGPREQFRNPDRQPQTYGAGGAPLKFVVMGDSTAAGQGTDPVDGIGPQTAQVLAGTRTVTLTNLGVSGATAETVIDEQLAAAEKLKPELVLLSVGANDVTKLSSLGAVRDRFETIVDRLIAANCSVKIVLTGSPDLGGAHRFAQPLRWVAGVQTARLNGRVESLATERSLTFAPIAAATGPAFRRDPTLLAADKFHPNATGYARWVAVLNPALADALQNQPSHCRKPAAAEK